MVYSALNHCSPFSLTVLRELCIPHRKIGRDNLCKMTECVQQTKKRKALLRFRRGGVTETNQTRGSCVFSVLLIKGAKYQNTNLA